ncbi:hypothetical protein ACQ858_15880 [Variovorax ureilyticus]|uniref:hypothetical protein n=1 Tax=Variovorax ureilyticus TaxID=1836198 RepID=UPI003D66E02F
MKPQRSRQPVRTANSEQAGPPPPTRRPRAPQAFNAIAGIPVSAYPGLDLPHPLELFGKELKVHVSTHFTFNPDTISRAVADVSLDAGMRKWADLAHQRLRQVAYVAAGKHRPSKTTRSLIARHLAPAAPTDVTLGALAAHDERVHPRSGWQTVLDGLQNGSDEALKDVCRCLAACDAHALHVRALAVARKPDAAIAHVAALLEADVAAWVELNPSLHVMLYALVEVALKTVAWLECRSSNPQASPPPETSLDGLLLPGHRPIGHWLSEVCDASDCRNLGELSAKLEWRSTYGKGPIAHDLLRKWSSCRRTVMPAAALGPVLGAVRLPTGAPALRSRFYAARLLTFLCALLRAGTDGPRPGWDEVQAQLRSRYAQAYRLQAAQPPAKDDTTSS